MAAHNSSFFALNSFAVPYCKMSSKTDYSHLAETFLCFKEEHEPSKFVEKATLCELLGPVKGLRVLDINCGFGYHSRWIKANGADEVCAFDLFSLLHLEK